jgi:excisionase family DNA binding protein
MGKSQQGVRVGVDQGIVPEASLHRLLNMDEAADYLHVSRRWVAEAVRQRRIRCTRIGKHVLFKVEHLEELIQAGEQPVISPPVRFGAGCQAGSAAITSLTRLRAGFPFYRLRLR